MLKQTNSPSKRKQTPSLKLKAWILLIGLTTSFIFNDSFAIPQGGVVAGGGATISSPSANTLQINQTTDRAIINWSSYNIGPQEKVNYIQPGSGSISLNRIDPNQGPSSIYGQINANGQVWLLNPAGIWFAPGSMVNVGGLLATTAGISDQDFMAGRYNFVQSPNWNGSIINDGHIVVHSAGLAALVGPGVVNNGRIEAQLGTVVLASGKQFTINFGRDNLVSFAVGGDVTSPAKDKDNNPLAYAVQNSGAVIANGGRVLMTARTAGQMLDHAINMSGVIEAKSVAVKNGEIILGGGQGTVIVSGKINASGRNAGEKGGTVKILGNHVGLINDALVDVSGDKGGGTILIGGNAHGKGPEQNASKVHVGQNVKLLADALTKGNGGKVVVWSNDQTVYQGSISARGGVQGGDGGWTEVSGGYLDFNGFVDTSAPLGKMGSLLLDPQFINVQAAGGSTYNPGVNNLFANNASGTTTITPASIIAAATNIVLQANTDVTFSSALAMTAAGASLTVQAGRDININANISTNNGAINMTANDSSAQAGNRNAGTGDITMGVGTAINAGTGAINLTIGSSNSSPFNPGSMSLRALTGGVITLTTPNAVTIASNVNVSSSLNVNVGTASSITSSVNGNGALVKGGVGTLTLGSGNNYSGGTVINAGTLANSTTNSLPTGTALVINDPGTYNMNNFSQTVASLSGSGTLTNTGANARTFTVNGSASTTFSGDITASTPANLALTYSGSGKLTLSGNNTYTGNTLVTSGTLGLGSITALGGVGGTGSALTISSGATIDINFGGAGTLANTRLITINGNGVGSLGVITGSDTTADNTLNNSIDINNSSSIGGVGNLVLNGLITGGANDFITKVGTGTITFGNTANTYTGQTIINNGTLVATEMANSGASSSLGAASTTNSRSTILIGSATTAKLAFIGGNDSSNRPIIINGAGGGIIEMDSAGTLTLSGPVTNNGNPLTFDTNTGNITVSGVISGSGSLTKLGSQTLTLSSLNTYSGATNIYEGILSANRLANTGTNSSIGTGNGTSTVTIGGATTSGTLQYTGVTVSTNRPFVIGAGDGTISISTALSRTLTLTGGINTGGNDLTIDTSGGGAGNITLSTTGISGAAGGSLTKTGSGDLTLNVASTYLGPTTINGGEIINGVTNGLPTTTDLTINNPGIFNMAGFAQQVRSLAGNGILTNTGAARTFTVSGSTAATTFSGNITATTPANLALTYAGGVGGVLNLSGNNTYTGATSVLSGILSIDSTTGLGGSGATGSATTVTSGATLDFGFSSGTLSNSNTITLNGNGVGSAGGLTFSGNNITINNPVTLGSASSIGGSGTGLMTMGGAITGASDLTVSLNNAALSLPTTTLTGGSSDLSVTTGGAITQTGALTIGGSATFAAGYANNITLNNAANNFNSIAITNGNNVSITDANALILTSASEAGTLTVNAGGLLTVAGNVTSTSNGNMALNSVGLTLNGAANINSGNGSIAINAGGGAVNMASGSTVTTTNSTGSALTLQNATTVALGNINVNSGTFTLGAGNVTGAVTQNAGTALSLNNFAVNTTSGVNLSSLTNAISNISSFTSNGTVVINNNTNLTISGSMNVGANPLTISTVLGTTPSSITINGNIISTGATAMTIDGQDITQGVGSIINNGSGGITLHQFTGTYTMNNNSKILSTGVIKLIGDQISISQTGTQIGGDGSGTGTDVASYLAIGPSTTPNVSIGIDHSGSTLNIPSNVLTNIVRASTIRIGTTSNPSGLLTINGVYTPSPLTTLFAIHNVSGIAQTASGGLNLGLNTGLMLSGTGTFDLTSGSNAVSSLAASVTGSLAITNSGVTPMTVTALTSANDFGTMTGITASGGVSLTTGGAINVNQAITSTNSPISLTGVGITQAANTTVNAGSGNITYNAGSGSNTFNANDRLFTTGKLTLLGNGLVINSATGVQFGGSGVSAGNATNAIIGEGTGGTTIGIAGGAGSLNLPTSTLNLFRAGNFRFGNGTSGLITVGAYTPTFVGSGNVVTLNSGAGVAQSGAMTVTNLILRGIGNFNLTNIGNTITNVASNLTGASAVSIINAATKPLTVSSLVDDIGSVVGMIAPNGVQLQTSGVGGLLSINQGITSTNSTVSLTGTGITHAASTVVNAGTGSIIENAGANALTLNANALLLSTGTINLTANTITNGAGIQIGGNALSAGFASNVIISPTSGTTIGVAGGSGSLQLSASLLNTIRANNVRIGSSTSGNINIASSSWTPAATFANNGVLTFDTAGTITQGAAINLVSNNTALLLRDASSVTLLADNAFGNIAANVAGAITLKSTLANPLTITNLTDDIGTVSGITAPNGVTLSTSNLTINQNINTSGNNGNVSLTNTGITLASGKSITSGSGTISLNGNGDAILLNGSLVTSNNTASAVVINNNSSATLGSITASAGKINVSSSGGITINSGAAIAANFAGDSIVMNGTQFTNNAGASVFNTGSGRFLIWSGNPGSDTRGGIAYNFKQYNAIFGSSTVLGTGNGFLYTLAPIVSPALTGTVSKVYNGNTAATLAAGNYTATGAIDGDIVLFNNPVSGTYATKNVGTGINVSVSGISLVVPASNGAASVYGYQLGSTTASGNVGVITPASLTVSSNSGQTKVYGNNDSAGAASAYSVTSGSLFGSDTLTGAMGRVAGENVGLYNFTRNTVNASDGNSGNNYNITFVGTTNRFQITPRALTATVSNQTKVYGANDPTISGVGVVFGNVVNGNVTDINGNVTAINDTGNVATTLATLSRAVGENIGSYNVTGATYNTLTGSAAANYTAPVGFTGTPTLTINKASLTGTIANQTKTYGADDPSLAGIGVTLNGLINRTVATWNGGVAVNDSALTTALSALVRAVGENVASYNITSGTFSAPSANYNAPTLNGTPTLTISKANLTGTIANQTKTYGANDPSLAGIGVNLTGLINRTVSTWNGSIAVNDSALTSSVTSLTRVAGENVGTRNITAGVFAEPSSNYNAPTFTGTPILTINKANLNGSISNQSKIYGADDPALGGIGVNLGGVINNPAIVTWNGNVSVNDTGNVTTTLASLARFAGENIGSYLINAATFNTLTGSAAGNYNAPSFSGAPTLTINKANLTGSIANQTKTYGADDPSLAGIGVTLNGLINRTVATWNGSVAVNDSALTSTLSALVREVGENVASYNITSGTFSVPSANYNAPAFTGTPTLTISKADLTGTIANQTKTYGANDPSLAGIGVNLTGLINRTVSTWNGGVTVNDSALTSSVTSLTRVAGENVGVRNITAGVFAEPSSNYNAPTFTGTPTLTINKANLTGSISNQSKIYGADDPALAGIGVNLGGVINNPAIVTWNGNVSVNDTGNVAATLASLSRVVGENVANYNITAGSFNSLTGSAAGNYNAPSFSGAPTLTINQANLTGTVANQTKVYGADDPTISGIGVTLNGLINRTVATWNGSVAVNDSALTTTLSALVRAAGENVASYNITSGAFSAPSANYNAPTLNGTPTLTITAANVTGSIANQAKVYGADDPSLAGVGATLNGLINRTVATWNGNVVVNDSALTTILSALVRAAGENVASYNITSGTFSAPSANYNAPTLSGAPILTISKADLTGSIANQAKVYGADDPSLAGIGVNLAGLINRTVSTWNGDVTVNDSALTSSVTSLTRVAGENVGARNITAGVFAAPSGNYNVPSFTGTPILTITKANLTGSIANQSKIYGADDPSLAGIGVNLGGVINNPAIVTWNGNVSVNDSGNVAATLASLSRVAGENVASYNITTGSFNTLTGSAAGNYNAPSFSGAPTLTINKANLTGSIANQTKTYGADDPSLAGIGVILGGVINNSAIVTWNGNVSVNDTGNVTTTLASLARLAGENIGSYLINAATFNALTGSAAGNYNAPNFSGAPTLTINKANLTGTIANQTKTYGADDPALAGIGVTLNGLINRTVATWNGNVAVNDSALTSTLSALVRAVGENVANYNITSGTFSVPSANYNVPTLSGAPILTISKADLTGSIANQTKVYGADDPSLAGIGVNLAGLINRTVSTWNGGVVVDDSALTSSVTSLTRVAGEDVGARNITAGVFAEPSNNYNAPTLTGTPTLTISKADLTGSIANQTKTYGADDPSLAGIGVNLTGLINRTVSTWNGGVTVNDSALTSSVTSLTRVAGENVGTLNIITGVFTEPSSNYNAPSFTGTPILTITKANLTGSIANQSKIYGADDPSLAGIGVNLGGVINNPAIVTWNGNVSVNDSGNVAATLASLSRVAGENVASYNITTGSFNTLTGSAAGNYNAPSFSGAPTLTINKANLTGSIANQTKTYGADDPSLAGIGVTLNGLINRTVATWNGSVAVNDSALTSTLSALVREVGENVASYNITSGTFSVPSANYNAPAFTGTPTLTISKADLTGTIANQTKTYGANDPSLVGIGVNLTGLINRTVSTWNGGVTVNDSALTSSVTSLTRVAGENVGVRNITAGVFAEPSSNYNAPTFTGTPILTINKANLTGSISNQSKIYGADDPALAGIGVNLGGVINNPAIVTWNGNVSVNDTGNVATTLASLARLAGENIGSYLINAATFNTLTGSAAGNYNAPSFSGAPTLTINKANLTGTIANQTKTYGADDPSLAGIGVNLTGLINRTVSTWNGGVTVDDSALTSSVTSLTRVAGENVGARNITAGVFAAPSGNYNVPSFTGTPILTITKANLTGSIANQSKIYGADDPSLAGIGVNLGGVINNPAIVTWNGNVSVNDSGNVAATLASLSRVAGENVASYNITTGSFNTLTGSAAGNYNAPSFSGAPTLTINKANLTGTIANQTKIYGADDPSLAGIGVNLTGLINRTVSTWNGGVVVNDSALTSSVSSLSRVSGENVGSHNIINGLFTIPSANYNAPTFTGAPTLTINKANLTGSISDQSKVYGADDPALAGIGVNLGGVINNPAIVTWNGNVSVNDSGNVAATLASLSRVAGENVASYNIIAGSFNALTGSAAGNYNAPNFSGAPTLTINKANLTGSIANQTKTYGADDPSLAGIGVILGGVINNSAIVTWNGNVSVNDTGNVTTTLASLARLAGENIGSYLINAATFNALTGSAAGNYNAPNFSGAPTLTINKANLTGTIANQTKTYGADDPALAGIGVTLNGLINRTVATWNGNVAVNDSALTSTLSALVRAVGENVASYNITSGTFSVPSANYNVPTLSGAPILTISKADLTGSIANQTKVYGADDPSLAGIGVNLAGLINRTVSTWNGGVVVDDSALTSTLSALVRAVGENIGSYNITSGTFSTPSANYNAPTLSGAPTLTISKADLTGSIANQTKVYGADDPALAGIGVTLNGLINRTVATWNGNVAVNDSALSTTLSVLVRAVGENVASYNITSGIFSAPSSNYNAPTLNGTPILTINKANLTGSIANQAKTYGADDPSLAGIGVLLGGVINNPAISTWNGSVSVNDSGNVAATLASLSRVAGENVASYNIIAGSFNALTGSAANNYNAPTFSDAPTLTISKADLTGSIANQTKVYGADDPSLAGIGVNLNGLINRTVDTWNGNVVVNDSALTTTLSALARAAGESVGNYNITSGIFSAPSANYNVPTFTGSPILTISKANLTGSIANQTKVYGADDPSLAGIGVVLNGLINRTVDTWNGNIVVNDSALTTTLSALTRNVGENIGSYNITSGTFSAPSANYNAPTLNGTPTLTINKANLTGSIANQTKVYGADDPSLAGIGVTLNGLINRTVSTWNGNVTVNDSALTSTLSALVRVVGENIGSYNITSGTFSVPSANYNVPTLSGMQTLIISKADLTGSIANQTKVYGANDPALAGIGVNLTGLINRTVNTWNGNVAVNDSALTSSVTSLTRVAGENVGNYSVTAGVLTVPSANYNVPTFTGAPILTINKVNVTGSVANQSKIYGADDPSLAGIAVNLTGLVNRMVGTWNGSVLVDDSGLVSSVTSLTRMIGENIGNYVITSGVFTAPSANYNVPLLTGSPSLTISKANLTGSVANQTKVYGANDPSLASIGVNLSGLINRTVNTWNGNVAVNDSALTSSVSSLSRVSGENVGSHNIINGLFTMPSANYNAPIFTGSPVLTITQANLTGSVANQSKVYGTNDPSLSGIGVNLSGLINRTVSTWNGNVAVNDNGNVAATLASLTRIVGENVGNYSITTGIFNALTGSAAGNYSAPLFVGPSMLTINKANLTGTTSNLLKIYGTSDSILAGANAILNGMINNNVVNWMGTSTAINDMGNVNTTMSSFTRNPGENVGNYAITNMLFNALLGSAANNYNQPTFAGSPILTITPATLTASLNSNKPVSKVYDTTTNAFLNSSNYILSGIVGSDNVIITTTNGIYDTKNVGVDKMIHVISLVLGGSAASNYVLANSSVSAPVGIITPASLSINNVTANNKVYNANTNATLNTGASTLNGVLGSDHVNLSTLGAYGIFATKNVGTGILVSTAGFALSGVDAMNYALAQPVTSANITPLALTVTGITANDKVANGSTSATLNMVSAILNGVLGSDSVTVNPNSNSYIANFVTANPGNNIPVFVSLLELMGDSAGNYTIDLPTGLLANILPNATPTPTPGPNANSNSIVSGIIFPTDYVTPESNVANTLSINNANRNQPVSGRPDMKLVAGCVAIGKNIMICSQKSPDLSTQKINLSYEIKENVTSNENYQTESLFKSPTLKNIVLNTLYLDTLDLQINVSPDNYISYQHYGIANYMEKTFNQVTKSLLLANEDTNVWDDNNKNLYRTINLSPYHRLSLR